MYELIVVYTDGTKSIYEYDSEAAARAGERGIRMALGNQVSWCGIVRK